MRAFVTGVVLVLLFGGIGCKKKPPTTPRDELARAEVTPAPQSAPAPARDKNKKVEPAEELNWVKRKPQEEPTEPRGDGLKQPWGATPPKGGWQNPNLPPLQPNEVNIPDPDGALSPPGKGVLQPAVIPAPGVNTPLGAAQKAVAMADMRDLQVFIHDSSLVMGRMPTSLEIYGALVRAKSPAADLVKNGGIILTGANQREAVWAFEAKAYLSGGLAVSQNGVETLTAEELKKRLGR